ncbi:MAG: hypothetical protein ABIN79_01305 [Marmoricola sp.]
MSTDADLRSVLAEAILGDRAHAPLESPEAQLALVARVRDAETEVRTLLQQSVNAARSAGQSWGAIGKTLGMSRQAVQQRFGKETLDLPEKAAGVRQRWLGPVTAFDEMPELELAGRLGWRTVGARMFYHLVEHTPTQWECRRTIWSGPTRRLEKDGWEVALLAFPWVYLIRDLGQPAPAPEPGQDSRSSAD